MKKERVIAWNTSVYEKDYRGYQILQVRIAARDSLPGHYTVGQDNRAITILAMYSPKACKNVIDTWINSQQVEPFKKLSIEL